MDKASYALGLNIGFQLRDLGATDLTIEDFSQAVNDVLKDNDLKISKEEIMPLIQDFMRKHEQKQKSANQERGKAAKAEGEKYLAENAKKDNVVTLPSGLQYTVLKEGSGKKPKAEDSVQCHYEGMLVDGTLFDSSLQRGEPATFPLKQVIKGWTEGLQLMREGAKYRFFIPYALGYGETGAGNSIPPYAALIFDVELLKVL